MATRVAVLGAAGRMGSTVCRAVMADPELDLVAAVDPGATGRPLAQVIGLDAGAGPATSIEVTGSADAAAAAGAQVAVDFSHLSAALANAEWCSNHDVHAVIGTSGFGPEEIERLRGWFPTGPTGPRCLVVPNFAISAVLAVRFAELAAPWFDTAEIIELHHDRKVDAPSGTAMSTAERMGAARQDGSGEWAPDPTRDEILAGARGARHASGIRIHSVRMRGMLAHEEIILGTTGQTLTIRQDSYDRESYMPGVVLAIKSVAGLEGVTVGLDRVIGI